MIRHHHPITLAIKTLIVIQGATGSGKTELALQVAEHLGCDIISADSRQVYRDIPIGTAAPTPSQLARVRHHLVGFLPLDGYYSAALFEEDVIGRLLPEMWARGDYAVMAGGSMMYIDAVCHGIDPLPTVDPEIRARATAIFTTGGLPALHAELQRLDPAYLERADLNNHKRLIHAIEVSMQAGVPYSSLCTGQRRERPFRIVRMAIDHPRDVLFDRINRRVDAMIAAGLEEEAMRHIHLRHLNSLNTVGYKEIYAVADGLMDRPTAIARIAKNTRVYAKKQLTWMHRTPSIHPLTPSRPLLQQALSLLHQEP